MFKYIVYAILIVFILKTGIGYFLSDEFQYFGDLHKAHWTCRVNNFLGANFITGSSYDRAKYFFERVEKRCPKTSMAEYAMFQMGIVYEGLGKYGDARAAYKQYIKKYPNTERAKLAIRSISVLSTGR